MKKIITLVFGVCLVFTLKAQFPNFQLRIENEQLVSTTEYQFDVVCYAIAPTTSFENCGLQLRINYNTTWTNAAGTRTLSIVPGSSDFSSGTPNQTPVSFGSATLGLLQVAAVAVNPGGGGIGVTITQTGVRLGRFRFTNSTGFSASVIPNLRFLLATQANSTKWNVNIAGSATAMLDATNINSAQASCFNPLYWDGSTWSGFVFDGTGSGSGTVVSSPASNLDATVYAGTVAGSLTTRGLSIITGTTYNLGNNTLNAAGNILNGGTFTHNSATINLNGNNNQTISSPSGNLTLNLSNLGFSGIGTKTLDATTITGVNVTGVVTPGGTAVLATNNKLVLKSTIGANATANIAAGNAAGNYITGNITVERALPSRTGKRFFTFIASPVSGLISTNWQQQIHITGTGTGGTPCPSLTPHSNGFDATLTNAASMFVYDPSLPSALVFPNRWVSITNTNATNLTPGTGYRINVRGPRSAGCALLDGTSLVPDAVTLIATGSLSLANKNAGNFTQSYTTPTGDRYFFAGNPYPSAILFSSLVANNNGINGIENNYAIYAPGNTAGNYNYWDGASFSGPNSATLNSLPGSGLRLQSGQAFFLQGKVVGPTTVNFNESQKDALGSTVGIFRTTTYNDKFRISYLLSDNSIADEIVVRYTNDATVTNSSVGNLDIVSINSGTQNLKSLKAGNQLVVNTRSLASLATDTVALNVVSTQNGNYKLSFSDYENFTGTDIYLIDSYSKSIQKMNDNPVYSFTVNTAIAATQGIGRFSVVFTKKAVIAPSIITSIKVYPNPVAKELTIQLPQAQASYTLRFIDLSGKTVLQQQVASGTQQLSVNTLSAGTYMLEITGADGSKSVKKIVKQ